MRLIPDDGAAAPVVGVALLIGITTLLAMSAGVFVLLSDFEEPAPDVRFEAHERIDDGQVVSIEFEFLGHDPVDREEVEVVVDSDDVGTLVQDGGDGTFETGDTFTVRFDRTVDEARTVLVVWTPEREDRTESLYDHTTTRGIAAYDPDPDPPSFAVSIERTTDPIRAGEELDVVATVENAGDERDVQTIALENPDGDGVDWKTVDLDGGQDEQLTLTWHTDEADVTTDDVTVSSADDSDAQTVEIRSPDAYFAVEIDDTNEPVVEGEEVEVEVIVENTGGEDDGQDVVLETVDGGPVDSESLQLDPDDEARLTLVWATSAGDAGDGEVVVSSQDETDTAVVEVLEPAEELDLESICDGGYYGDADLFPDGTDVAVDRGYDVGNGDDRATIVVDIRNDEEDDVEIVGGQVAFEWTHRVDNGGWGEIAVDANQDGTYDGQGSYAWEESWTCDDDPDTLDMPGQLGNDGESATLEASETATIVLGEWFHKAGGGGWTQRDLVGTRPVVVVAFERNGERGLVAFRTDPLEAGEYPYLDEYRYRG